MAFTVLPYDTPLNAFQKSLINMPYQESGISRGIAYLQDPTTRGVERLLSPNHALQGSLEYQPTQGQLVAQASSREIDFIPEDSPRYETPTAGGIATMCYFNSGLVGIGAVSPATFFGLAQTTTLTAGASLGISAGVGCALGLVIFQGIAICVNISRIRGSDHYQAWKRQRIEIMTEHAVGEFFKKDDILTHLLCPISGKVPLVPAKDLESVTYDYESAVAWILRNPGRPLPASTVVVTVEQLTFDFEHINTVVDRLGELRSLITREQPRFMNTVARDRVPLPIVGLHNDALRIIVQNQYLTLQEGFQDNRSLDFIQRLLTKCGEANTVGINARRAFYNRNFERVMNMPRASREEFGAAIRAELALNDSLRGIKHIHVYRENPFSAFFIELFGGCASSYRIERVLDVRVQPTPSALTQPQLEM